MGIISRGFSGRRGASDVKLATTWEGVSLDTLFANVKTDASYVTVESYGDYTTNLPLKDLMGGQAWVAFRFDGKDLAPEHGGPARLLVPHLYFWKSAKMPELEDEMNAAVAAVRASYGGEIVLAHDLATIEVVSWRPTEG
jgi:hypothetical protein